MLYIAEVDFDAGAFRLPRRYAVEGKTSKEARDRLRQYLDDSDIPFVIKSVASRPCGVADLSLNAHLCPKLA